MPIRRPKRATTPARRRVPGLSEGRAAEPLLRVVQRLLSSRFSEQMEEAINRYTNRSLTTAEIIAELVELAKEMREQAKRHGQLGLSEAEAAFYDAIAQNDAAVLQLGNDRLRRRPLESRRRHLESAPEHSPARSTGEVAQGEQDSEQDTPLPIRPLTDQDGCGPVLAPLRSGPRR
jgi:hypothetical protein